MAERYKLSTPTLACMLSLDRASERRADKDWIAERLADPASRFLLLIDLKLVLDANSVKNGPCAIRWLRRDEVAPLKQDLSDSILLGCMEDGGARFALPLRGADTARLGNGAAALEPNVDLRSLAVQGALPPDDLALVGAARALCAWHESHRCCGRCGAHTFPRDGGWRRQCWACGQSAFPRSDPAVITLVTHGEHCLLAHHRRFNEPRYTVLAGFVEPGEDIEATVRREVREESGVEVDAVTYLGSQPWPFPHSLMIGCWAEAKSRELKIDQDELVAAIWADRDEARAILDAKHPKGFVGPGPFSIAHMLIRSFIENA